VIALSAVAPPAAAATQCTGDLTRSNPANRIVELETSLGSICIELLDDQAPLTTQNFVNYLNRGDLDGAILNRALPGFVLQGGGFRVGVGPLIETIPKDAPVTNEPCTLDEDLAIPVGHFIEKCSVRGNVAGTLSMAKAGDPSCMNPVPRPGPGECPLPQFVNSATSEWFVNLADNRDNLDNQNGGFTVFAVILGDGLAVAQAIAALDILPHVTSYMVGAISAFGSLPVQQVPAYSSLAAGCFDPTKLAGLVNTSQTEYLRDPINVAFFHLLVSGACGTLLASGGDYMEDPSQTACPSNDEPALQLIETMGSVTEGTDWYQLTCDEIEASLAATRSTAMPQVVAQLAVIETATNLPEPSSAALAASALLALAALSRHARRA
jgi:cyclophilin family peptidyl-prolyl cis-trans isomerase